MEVRRIGLRHPYFSVKTQDGCSYGGSQTWSSSRMMRKVGCGVVGISDVCLYLGLHRSNYKTDLHYGILREDGYISFPRYERYVMKMRRRYLKLIPGLGVPGFLLPLALNRYFQHYRIEMHARWCFCVGKMFSRIEKMLAQDIPVILAVGPNFPFVWGKKKVTFYKLENGVFYPATETKSHFVVVTGLVDEYLQISSWGKEYYISWPEYLHYVRHHSSCFGSNICLLKEKKKRKYL